ncbi:acyltransferase family protein [uncultured Prevotella sp.]|uniref:acyltransferase family protein n=1 Tax=uncultured Prevotella sp. TaxID=159272 RepID=UPI0025E170A6|nr:acyltransferase family protein [uncultured Prevotella sp.]
MRYNLGSTIFRRVIKNKIEHNNYITIAKAIVIITMVIGHSGCPYALEKVIYSFHMPFFFVCSGYFFHIPSSKSDLLSFYTRKVKGIYLPFLKWCFLFLLLHNAFYYLDIYNNQFGYHGSVSNWMTFNTFVRSTIHMLLQMNDIPSLLGGFWFLKNLFFASLLIALLSFVTKPYKVGHKYLFFIILVLLAFVSDIKYIGLYFIGLKELLWSSVFFYSGFLMKDVIIKRHMLYVCIITFTGINILPFYLHFYVDGVGMMFLFYISGITGTILIFHLSRIMESLACIKQFLYYAGNHTLIILGFHFLTFKLVSLLIIVLNGLPMAHLAELPVIENYKNYWFLYSIVGVIVPLTMSWTYEKICFYLYYKCGKCKKAK